MSLRTRRSLAFPALLVLLVVACGGGTNPTPTPAGPTAAPTPTGATTPGPTGSGSVPTGSGSLPTGTPGEATGSPVPSGLAADQTFRIYCCATDPRSLRPQAASGSDEISIISGIQRGLLYLDKDLQLVPSLATALPTVSDDGLTYTYNMRPDAKYSDGTPIVAADIVRAARALADPRNAFDYGYEMCYLAGAADVLGTDFGCSSGTTPALPETPFSGSPEDVAIDALLDNLGVVAQDDHTVVFTLSQKTSFWPNITGMWLLSPVPESQTSWAEAANIVSSGPFMIDTWTHNSEIDLVPNPNWYGTTPTLQKIEIHIGGDPTAALAEWERGGLDLVAVPSTDIRRVLDTADYAPMINRSTQLSVEYWDFANCQAKDADGNILCPPNAGVTDGDVPGGSPTQNKLFREALTQALDRDLLLQSGFAGIGQVAYSPTMPGIPGFPTITADNNPFPYDPAAARTLMDQALAELGVAEPDPATILPATDTCDDACQHTEAWVKGLGPLRFGYNCDANHDQRVLIVAQQWRNNLGFTGDQMDIRCTDFGTFRTERRAGNIYSIARNGWSADFPHPDNQNRDLFACGAGNNNSKYCSQAYDDLLNQGASAGSYDEALPFYQQAEQLLVQDAPVVFLRFGEGIRLVRPYVGGLMQTASDHQNVGDLFYETIQIMAH